MIPMLHVLLRVLLDALVYLPMLCRVLLAVTWRLVGTTCFGHGMFGYQQLHRVGALCVSITRYLRLVPR